MGHLSLALLGPFQVTWDGRAITNFESNKVRALLAYLAVEAGRPHSRETLAGLLWPERSDRAALNNLRTALADLRQVICDRQAEPPFLLITRDTIQFNPASDYSLDVEALKRRAAVGRQLLASGHQLSAISHLQSALDLERGYFLEGFAVSDCVAFEEWMLLTRERISRLALDVLCGLSTVYQQLGEYEQACAYVRRQLEQDPWNEEAHRCLMRLLVLAGQRSAALAQYETCRRQLRQELHIEPASETTALYESIRDGTLDKETGERSDTETRRLGPPLATPFVARERELARLNRWLEMALAGQGRAVFVTGDAGSGKTTLVNEFARRAMTAHEDVVVASGSCKAYAGIGIPYLPFIEIMQMLTGDTTSSADDLQLQAALFAQYWQVLRTIARRHSLILVLDDLQWIGIGSASLLFHLGRQLANERILMVGAYRPAVVALGRNKERHPLEPVVNELQRVFGDIQVDLMQADGQRFVEAYVDSEPNCLGAAFRETLYRHTGGHALFTVELLRGLQERGSLVRDEYGRWVEGPALDWDKLPARVEAVIAERIGRLSPDCKAILLAACVQGEEFIAEVVARVQHIDEHSLVRRLSSEFGQQHRLVRASSRQWQSPGGQSLSRYRFWHPLFQRYLYQHMDPVERAHLHQATGNALEALYQGQTAAVAARLAWHFEAAGMNSKAAAYLLQAGDTAMRQAANAEAMAHLVHGFALPAQFERNGRLD